MNINNTITETLDQYNFKLTEHGILAIRFQVELLYGKHPTESQITEVVESNIISFIDEQKEVNGK